MKIRLLFAFLLFAFAPNTWGLTQVEEVITRAEWPQYANGSNIAVLPQAAGLLQRFREDGNMDITIRYPGGDVGLNWGQTMYNWFVAYGVPSQYLKLELGSGGTDRLLLVLIDRN